MKSLQSRDQDESKLQTEESDSTGISGNAIEDLEGKSSDPECRSTTCENVASSLPSVKSYSTLFKVGVCVVAGILATQLQFAFVFGQDLVDLSESSEGPRSTPSSGSAAVIWLFAFTVSVPPSLLYGVCNTSFPLRNLLSCGIYRHLVIFLTATLPWVGHVHLYGIANAILPEDLAAAVSWPVLMMATVVVGMIWSTLLGEWKNASRKARIQLFIGLGIVLVGIMLLILSLVVD